MADGKTTPVDDWKDIPESDWRDVAAPKQSSAPSRSFGQEHPYFSAATSMIPGIGPAVSAITDPTGEVGKGALKQAGRDLYETTRFAGPLGMGIHAIGEKTGLGEKIQGATEPVNEQQRAGSYAMTAAELAPAVPAVASLAGRGIGSVVRGVTRMADNPLVNDVIGLVSPRAAHGLSLARRSARVAEGLAPSTVSAPPALPQVPPSLPVQAAPIQPPLPPAASRVPLRPPVSGPRLTPEIKAELAARPIPHKSPAVVSRQLSGTGTLAENPVATRPAPTGAFTNEAIPVERRIRALEIAEQLKQMQG